MLPRGNTWTCEASHEFANVNGARNTEFWQKARLAGSPLKIFIQPGSAVPPSAWEESGGWYGYDEQKRFLADDLSVTSLDEVMDWPSVWNPDNPGYARMWGMIGATFEMRGVVEGHGSGLTDPHDISAFAAAGLSSDHEVWALDEAWDRLMRGIFVELRPFSYDAIIPGLIERGLKDWSNVALTTDDRSASETLVLGASDHNVRHAIAHGLGPEIAIQCATINPARHMRIDQWVGSITPGRYADIVLLDDVASVSIAHVFADGQLVSNGKNYVGPLPAIDWPDWATRTMNVGRLLSAADFAIDAEPGRKTMQAAVLRPFHWNEDFLVEELAVADGKVQRDDGTADHQMGAGRPLPRRRRGGQDVLDRLRPARIPAPRWPARWRMTATMSGSSAPATRRWRRRSTGCRRSTAAGCWCIAASSPARSATRSPA